MTNTTKPNAKAAPVVLPADLRDYFAAKAMQGFLAEAANPRFGSSTEPPNAAHWPAFASDAYALADAMLAARGAA